MKILFLEFLQDFKLHSKIRFTSDNKPGLKHFQT